MESDSLPQTPVIGFVAPSGTGKTSYISRLIPLMENRGINVAVIKHTHHDFEIDKPGKDSYKFRNAGARQTVIAAKSRIASITELRDRLLPDANLAMCLRYIDKAIIDLVIVEGFKHEQYAKIEIHRSALKNEFLFHDDSNIIALVSDARPESKCDLPIFDINDPKQISEFIISIFKLKTDDE